MWCSLSWYYWDSLWFYPLGSALTDKLFFSGTIFCSWNKVNKGSSTLLFLTPLLRSHSASILALHCDLNDTSVNSLDCILHDYDTFAVTESDVVAEWAHLTFLLHSGTDSCGSQTQGKSEWDGGHFPEEERLCPIRLCDSIIFCLLPRIGELTHSKSSQKLITI